MSTVQLRGGILRSYRERLGVTQLALARAYSPNASRQRVGKLERGEPVRIKFAQAMVEEINRRLNARGIDDVSPLVFDDLIVPNSLGNLIPDQDVGTTHETNDPPKCHLTSIQESESPNVTSQLNSESVIPETSSDQTKPALSETDSTDLGEPSNSAVESPIEALIESELSNEEDPGSESKPTTTSYLEDRPSRSNLGENLPHKVRLIGHFPGFVAVVLMISLGSGLAISVLAPIITSHSPLTDPPPLRAEVSTPREQLAIDPLSIEELEQIEEWIAEASTEFATHFASDLGNRVDHDHLNQVTNIGGTKYLSILTQEKLRIVLSRLNQVLPFLFDRFNFSERDIDRVILCRIRARHLLGDWSLNNNLEDTAFLDSYYFTLLAQNDLINKRIQQSQREAHVYFEIGVINMLREQRPQAKIAFDRYQSLVTNPGPEEQKVLVFYHMTEGDAFKRAGDQTQEHEQFAIAAELLKQVFSAPVKADPTDPSRIFVDFCDEDGDSLPDNWNAYPRIGPVNAAVVRDSNNVQALRIWSEGGAFGFYRRVQLSGPNEDYRVRWSWRVDELPESPDYGAWIASGEPTIPGQSSKNPRRIYWTNQPVQVMLLFHRSPIMGFDGSKPRSVVLQYSWDPHAPVETFYLDREDPGLEGRLIFGVIDVPTFVLESGPRRVGQWIGVERDFAADYRAVFPNEKMPPLVAVGIQISSQFGLGSRPEFSESAIKRLVLVNHSTIE